MEDEEGNKGERGRLRLEYFPQIMECGTFRKMKELACDSINPVLGLTTKWR